MATKEALLKKYAEGTISTVESAELEEMVSTGIVQLEELSDFQNLSEALAIADDIEPGSEMDSRFYAMLQSNVKRESTSFLSKLFSTPVKWAFASLLLVLTFIVGQQFGTDNQQLSSVNLTTDFPSELLATESVNKKISLVANTTINEETDQKVIDALLFALNNDESNNVRLACINTLYDYAYLPEVRAGLINAISSQNSPLVLSNLAEAINASGNRLSPDEFKSRIKKEMPPPLRNLVEQNITNI